jgi:hypothetical protein
MSGPALLHIVAVGHETSGSHQTACSPKASRVAEFLWTTTLGRGYRVPG